MTDIRLDGLAKSATETSSVVKAAQDGWDKSLASPKVKKEQPSGELDFSAGDPLAKTKKDSSSNESHVGNAPVKQGKTTHMSDSPNQGGPDAPSKAAPKPDAAADSAGKPGQQRQVVKPEHRTNGTTPGGGTGTGGDTIPAGKPVHRPEIKPGDPKPVKYPK